MQRLAAAAMLLAFAPSAHAHDASAGIGAYVALCPAALLDPDSLPHELEQIDMHREFGLPYGKMTTEGYASADGDINVSVTAQTFPDAVHRYCVTALFEPLDFDALIGVRKRLEANPLIGPLDGQMLPMPGGIVIAYLKKPGNDPIVVVSLTGARTSTTLALETWTRTP